MKIREEIRNIISEETPLIYLFCFTLMWIALTMMFMVLPTIFLNLDIYTGVPVPNEDLLVYMFDVAGVLWGVFTGYLFASVIISLWVIVKGEKNGCSC
jgi:hypothetical protein